VQLATPPLAVTEARRMGLGPASAKLQPGLALQRWHLTAQPASRLSRAGSRALLKPGQGRRSRLRAGRSSRFHHSGEPLAGKQGVQPESLRKQRQKPAELATQAASTLPRKQQVEGHRVIEGQAWPGATGAKLGQASADQPGRLRLGWPGPVGAGRAQSPPGAGGHRTKQAA